MPLFPNVESQYSFGGKSHTNLVISEGAAPAEKWIVSKGEGFKFNYAFGPEGNQDVVLAKGKLVELDAAEFDSETSRHVSTIKQATEGSKRAFGVNHHNVYGRRRDRFSGNNQPNPVVITRSYIEVPLFEHGTLATAQEAANAMQFGATYGESGVLRPGDFVKVGANGNFTRLDEEAGNAFEIIGQVGAVERELPPAGFLQYYMDLKIDELEAFLKAKSHAPSPGNNGTDAGAYPYGYPYKNKGWEADYNELMNPASNKGIPFLTDGYFAAKQTVTDIKLDDIYDATENSDGQVEAVLTKGLLAITGSTVVVEADSHNNAVFVKLRHPIDKGSATPIAVKYNTAATDGDAKVITAADLHIDYTNNTVVMYLEPGTSYHDVAIDADLVVDPIAGMPTEWDHAGSVGAVRILLQR
jgi:hypothetical protein